jgi:pyrroline-5-carboxylate reductase
VVLATKPQEAPATLPHYARFAGGAVFVSIMAGKTIAGMAALLGAGAAIVRAMPNTPAAVRQGFTVACAGPGVSPAQRALADTLLGATGEIAWVEEEGLLDPVTAVSGGGPAYVFLLAELLEAAAVEQGIPQPLARRMARATVAGSGALLAASTEDTAQLRKNVTSPKGTTERALAVLMESSAWPDHVSRAIAAATARSRELAG